MKKKIFVVSDDLVDKLQRHRTDFGVSMSHTVNNALRLYFNVVADERLHYGHVFDCRKTPNVDDPFVDLHFQED